MASQLGSLIRSEHVDIVHTFFETSDIWGGTVAKLNGCRALISSRRDMGILRSRKHSLAYRATRPLVDRVLTVSEEVRSFCIAQDHLDSRRVITIYNGINLQSIPAVPAGQEVRRRFDISNATPVITMVGNIRRVKAVENLIRAAAIVCRQVPDARFLIAGKVLELDYYAELQQLSDSLGVQDVVWFLNAVDPVFPLLQASNVFCLLSNSEGQSNAILEAMACRLPCVATAVGGNLETVNHNETGFLVPPNNPEEAAAAILLLLRDPMKAKLMGEAGRRLVEKTFNTTVMMDQLCNVYDEVLREKRR